MTELSDQSTNRLDVSWLAEDAGIDTSVCEFCHAPLDDSEPWRRGADGCGAHERCLTRWL